MTDAITIPTVAVVAIIITSATIIEQVSIHAKCVRGIRTSSFPSYVGILVRQHKGSVIDISPGERLGKEVTCATPRCGSSCAPPDVCAEA